MKPSPRLTSAFSSKACSVGRAEKQLVVEHDPQKAARDLPDAQSADRGTNEDRIADRPSARARIVSLIASPPYC